MVVVRVRKTVTALFADVVGSTSLGEQVDPEAMRNALERYFAAMRVIVEGHGGTVEKFIGDAVLAVFGIPSVHEDDALRAVRAAVAMREELERLRPELGIELRARIGINTGEVVAGEGDTFATGDTLNVAARLEQWAEPDEILIGASTEQLVSDQIRVEALEPLSLKGKAEPVAAFRLLEVLGIDREERRLVGPLVGRRQELERLSAEFDRTVAEASCRLVAITGEAGIGKSRLVREFTSQIEDTARLLIGRSLSYGEGITYWPLRDVVHQLAGADPLPELTGLLEDDTVAETVVGAIGAGPSAATSAEIQWSVRRLLETLAAERPLVLVLDDLHWAEPTFLDLVDYLNGFIRSVPVLLVATGRPELFDVRPEWRTSSLELSPLSEAEATELVQALSAEATREVSVSVVESAEGNPLFVEQLCAIVTETGELTLPPSVHALLATRIDQLPAAERGVAERGAIEGRLFHRGSVNELSADATRPDVAAHLASLVRRDLIRPAESLVAGDDAYRFSHALVREAVYSATPKADRAELHERLSGWLERTGDTGLGQLEEILGYHLEQAHELRGEVMPPDERTRDLGARAARLLGAAGRRALARGDFRAAENLLERAVAAAPGDDRDRLRYLIDLSETVSHTRDMAEAADLAEQVQTDAVTTGDEVDRARADLLLAEMQSHRAEINGSEVHAVADRAIQLLSPLGDHHSLARAWHLKAEAANLEGGASVLTEEFSLEALRHARRDGDGRLEFDAATYQCFSWALGPTPTGQALALCDELQAATETKLAKATIDGSSGYVLGLAGHPQEGWQRNSDARNFFREIGDVFSYAGTAWVQGEIEVWLGDLEAAEQTISEGCQILEEVGENSYRSSTLINLARVRLLVGDFEQAEALALEGRRIGTDDDIVNELWSRLVLAHIRAARGEFDVAETLAREAVEVAAPLHSPQNQGQAWLVLARVLARAERGVESREAASEAVRLFEQKGAAILLPQALALAGDPTPT
jgi:class 3 adenylate cyclase/tetratricopeptide (TPR) repeat protein